MSAFVPTLLLATTSLVAVSTLPTADLRRYSSPAQGLGIGRFWYSFLLSAVVKSTVARQQASPKPPKSTTSALDPSGLTVAAQPPFLRRPILFDRNSLELHGGESDTLQQAAAWLKMHTDTRVLIVGSCDTSGSESCTHTLAEARGAVVRKFLEHCGVNSVQVVGVKGWDHADHDCRPRDAKCQQLSRSAELFLAASAPRLKD